MIKRTRVWIIVAVMCIIISVYGVVFVSVRKAGNVRYFPRPGADTQSVVVYYFSKDDATNRALYYCFLPIHGLIGMPTDEFSFEDTQQANTPVYVRDLTWFREHLEFEP